MIKHIPNEIDEEVFNKLILVKGKRTWEQFYKAIAENGLKE